ncbi:MAG: hypothetical protein B0W54_06865 [Cellvibrio sp. 79]|nr:MAG: hypothetical protein B0W54_06865 [Cellvibrio sp. 79]
MSNQQVEIFITQDGQAQLSVALDKDTVWLTQAQMAELFTKDVRTINEHIGNLFYEQELEREATIRKFRIVRKEGNREVTREIEHYNLDVIISVGYRVKSQRGVQFRQWATQTLKQHLVQGYTLNQKRLQERGVEFEQVLTLLSQTLTNRQLINTQGEAVIAVINDYARSWSLLQGYDEQSLKEIINKQDAMRSLNLNDALNAIGQLKRELINKGEATELFGQLRGEGLASAIATIEQGFGDELFYPNIASRAAHLLYFVIKNHPLADGNKRTGSFLFLWYLRINQHLLAKPVEQLINDNTLVALALLVAESKPEQKELMIRLVEHFLLLI